jgi:16S rRNA G966 N2-methylase RsmD
LRNASGTGIKALRSNLLRLAERAFADQAVIFLDPPYHLSEAVWGRMGARLRCWIAPTGVLVFETDRQTTLELQTGWALAETREYGAARFHFWTPV